MQYRQHRYPTQFPIKIRAGNGQQDGHVLDVNNAGARLAGVRNLRRGDKIQVNILSQQVNAVVHWATGDRAGIAFRPQLTDQQMDTLRYRRDRAHYGRRGSVGFSFAEM